VVDGPEDDAPRGPPGLDFARLGDLLTRHTLVLYALSLALIVLVGVLDWWSGDQVLLYVLHLVPVGLLAWGRGAYAGLGGAIVATGVTLLAYRSAAGAFRTIHMWQGIVCFVSGAAVAWTVARVRHDRVRIVRLLEDEHRLAREDPHTGLPSARAFHERLALEIERMRRHGRPLSLLYLDIDDFKSVNDQRGHQAGDQLLARVGRILRATVRAVDLCARLGGDEFAILMPETSAEEAASVAERVRASIRSSFSEGGASVGASMGLATFDAPPIDAQAPLSVADGLMYEAKRSGKNRIVRRSVP
jgi:diguanylate cyclase (GGDEF)-like protein